MVDLVYKKRFRITTPIRYLEHSIVEKGEEQRFNRAWKRVFNKSDNDLSPTRQESFDRCLARVEREGSDEYLCQRIDIRYIGKKIGYGVFAKQRITPYTVLGYYSGVFTRNEHLPKDTHSTFEFTDFNTYSLAAEKVGGWARFMNHSDDETANVIAWEYFSPDMPYIFFTAGSRGIKKGAQLLYSYGETYWEDRSFHNF